MIDADYENNLLLLANTPAKAESLLYSMEQTARGIDLYVNVRFGLVWFGFYGISTFVGYLTPNPFLSK